MGDGAERGTLPFCHTRGALRRREQPQPACVYMRVAARAQAIQGYSVLLREALSKAPLCAVVARSSFKRNQATTSFLATRVGGQAARGVPAERLAVDSAARRLYLTDSFKEVEHEHERVADVLTFWSKCDGQTIAVRMQRVGMPPANVNPY